MANPHADLAALSVRRPAGPSASEIRPPRRWGSRVFVPGLLLAGFAGLAAWSAWDLIVPPRPVQVVPVQVKIGAAPEASGAELFKANGWVEPRPLPVDVPVQTEGMYRVKEVRVNPGDRVTAGQVLVLLDDEAARLNLDSMRQRHGKRQAAVKSAEADVAKAEVMVQNVGALHGLAQQEGVAEVKAQEAAVVKADTVLAAAEYTVTVEESLVKSGVAPSDVKVRQAKQQRDVSAAEVASAKAMLGKVKVAADVRVGLAAAARATAEAEVRSVRAKVGEAEQDAAEAAIDVKKAELELSRTRIVSPIDGAVMQLNVRAGTVMGGRVAGPETKDIVATLYEPKRLQVRVEVPIAKFQFVRYGQPAVVEFEDVLPGKTFTGTVLYDTRLTNVARNSVPVKVALPDDPPEQLRPEMIASVRFQAAASKEKAPADPVRRLVVPRRLLLIEGDAVRVWVVDPVGRRAELRAIELPAGERDRNGETVEVVGGLNPTDKLIATGREGLTPGSRVQVVGEER